ncbi:MAG: hypothetical protein JWN52_6612 [Actinomycetia bacterium]|nr:hypothetical protein [Actinomycetes bacterium]
MTAYALIDTDGALHMLSGDFTAEFGADGTARVNLSASQLPIAGWVGDCSLVMPDVPRNSVGAAVLCCLGAGIQPYAGPVVITGFVTYPYEPDACDLDAYTADYLPRLHRDVRVALGLDSGELPVNLLEEWAVQVREIAETARAGSVPPIRISRGDLLEEVDAGDADGVIAAIEKLFGGVA